MIILRSKNFWVLAAACAFYWGVAPLVPRHYVFDFVNAFSIAGVAGVFVMYYASICKKEGSLLWFFRNDLTGAHYFIASFLGLCLYVLFRHLYTAVWRWSGKPDWMIDSLLLGFVVYMTALLALMQLLSRDVQEGQIPKGNWRWVGIFTAIAIALVGVSILYLDPKPVSYLAGPGLK